MSSGETEDDKAQGPAESVGDFLLEVPNDLREKVCAWKIMCSPHFQSLTFGSWYWRAINIPLDLVNKDLQGDIDLLFCARRHERGDDGKHRFSRVYRSFELKTAKAYVDGSTKSLKLNKMHKVKGQLEKLQEIGSPQTFLLDVFILQVGFSDAHDGEIPDAIKDATEFKNTSVKDTGIGYAAFAMEQVPGYHHSMAGRLWPTETIEEASTQAMGDDFRQIVDTVEEYVREIGGAGHKTIITFCTSCRKLTHATCEDELVCRSCQEPLI